MNHLIVLAFCTDVTRPFLKQIVSWTANRATLLTFSLLIVLLQPLRHPLFTQTLYAQTITPIYAIQGDGLASPLREQRVDTYGVVTGVTTNGFYLQDPVGDGNLQTSDALFVYTYHRPELQVGQCAYIGNGRVIEFYAKTELTRADFIEPSSLCMTRTIKPIPLPATRFAQEPAELFEPYEGMLVTAESLSGVVQGPTKRFKNGEAEIALIAPDLVPYLPNGRLFHTDTEEQTALMYLSNALGASLPDVGWGDAITVSASLDHGWETVAILDYNFGKYQLLPLPAHEIDVTPRGSSAIGNGSPIGETNQDEFTLCTFNAYGFGRGTAQFPDLAEYNAQLYKRALAIATQLGGCTIIGLQESGTPQDAENLATLLRNSFDLDYVATAIPGPGTYNPEFPLTNSFLTRATRVQISQATLHQGCSDIDYDIVDNTTICAGQYPLFNRPPLLLDVTVVGNWQEPYSLTLINNHWKSKGGDESINVVRREAQARHVAALVEEKRSQSSDSQVVVLGDLNDFYDSDPITAIRTIPEPDLLSLHEFIPESSRYSYIYNGASQLLDYMLITPNMLPQFAAIHPIHINADFPYPTEVDTTTVYHATDHDPLIARIRPMGAAILGGSLKFANIRVQLLDEGESSEKILPQETTTDALGEFRFWDLAPGSYQLRYQPPPYIDLTEIESSISLSVGYNTIEATDIAHDVIMVATGMAMLSSKVAISIATTQGHSP